MAAGVAERSAAGFLPSPTDVLFDPDAGVAELAAFPASGASAQALVMVDESRLSEAGRIDYLIALRKQEGALAAARIRTLAALGAGAFDERDYVGLEVAPALQVSQTVGMTKLHHARFVCSTLPESLDALARGELTELHLRILVEGTWTRSATVSRAVQARVLDQAGSQPPGRFRATVREAVLATDAAREEERRLAAKEDRAIRFRPADDGMTMVFGLMPSEDAAALDTVIDAVAAELTHADDGLTNDQRRCDALGQIGRGVLADPALLRRQGQEPAVNVTIDWTTLLGLLDDPAWLAGHGPIGAEHARQIAVAATRWHILLTDDAGHLVARSVDTYEPSPALRAMIVMRDRWCVFPGCTARAERCDIDHVVSWRLGGPTDAANLEPLCRHHHIVKTIRAWLVARLDAEGTTTWTGPTGHTWTTQAPPQPGRRLRPSPTGVDVDTSTELQRDDPPF